MCSTSSFTGQFKGFTKQRSQSRCHSLIILRKELTKNMYHLLTMKLATFALLLPHLLVTPTAAHLRLRNQQRQLQECEGSNPFACGCDSVLQNDYRGDISTTVSGRTCQSWGSQSPHSHSRTAANYPDKGLGDHNYCRNPDGEPRAWCYTTDSAERWEYCDVPSCTPSTTTTSTTTTTTGTTVFSTTSSTQLPTCKTPELAYLDELDVRAVLKDAISDCETALSKKKVFMIGVDGLRADVVGMTPLPHIARLKSMGTHSFWADVQVRFFCITATIYMIHHLLLISSDSFFTS